MKKKILLISGLSCFAIAWSGVAHSLLTIRRTEAQMTDDCVKTVEGVYMSGATLPLTQPMEYKFTINGAAYETRFKKRIEHSGHYYETQSIFYSELIPSIYFLNRPAQQPEKMADALWGIGFVMILLSFRVKSPVSYES